MDIIRPVPPPLHFPTIATRVTAATSAHACALEAERLDREARENLRLSLGIGCEVAEVFDMKGSDVLIAKDSEPLPMLMLYLAGRDAVGPIAGLDLVQELLYPEGV
jgi:hypothetical protein